MSSSPILVFILKVEPMSFPSRKMFFAITLFAASPNVPAQTTSPAATRPAITLQVGDPAPEFKTGGFVQGKEFSTLEKGHVYVLEFWATWCGPCIGQMPHLSQLSEKYKGKVTFVGLDGLEHKEDDVEPDTMALVKHFMQTHPGRMTYDVAIDSADHHMVKSWFRAAGRGGIPCTFIVDQKAEIAWIGLPMQMEEPLAGVVAGTFDGKKYLADLAAKMAILAPIREAAAAHDYALVLSLGAALEKQHPELLRSVYLTRFIATLNTDPVAAETQFKKTIDANRTEDAFHFAQVVGTTPHLSPDLYATAAVVLKNSLESSNDPERNLDTTRVLSQLNANAGNFPESLTFAERAIDIAKANHFGDGVYALLQQELDQVKAQVPKAATQPG